MNRPRSLLEVTPAKIAGVYVLLGFAWIATSDRILDATVESHALFTQLQSLKGGLFVGISGAVLWGLGKQHERQLLDSRDRLEEVSQQLQVLHRVFRHNIRNDLTVIGGYIDLAADDCTGADARAGLSRARHTADEIVEMGEKLRVADQYDVTAEVEETIDVADVLEWQVERFRERYPEANLEASIPDSASVRGDDAVAHVLREVLENCAEHFDGPESDLEVRVAVEQTPRSVRVHVEDNGPGIPAGELEALTHGGESDLVHLSSVGLWVVQWLCDRIDADLEFESERGAGTRVEIEFVRPPSLPTVEWRSRALLNPMGNGEG